MAESWLPTREAELVSFVRNFNGLIAAGPTSFSLTAGQATTFTGLWTTFRDAYDLAVDPPTRTSVTIADKNVAKEAMIDGAGGIRELVRIIQASPTVTAGQKESLGLRAHDVEPSPVAAPEFPPQLAIEISFGRTVKLRLRDAENPDRRGRPDGVDGATVLMYAGDEPPADPLDWSMLFNTSKTLVDIELPVSVAPGAKVWFSAFWFNQRKQSSPTAAPVSTRVADGLAAAA